jgi:hypothetical protein
MNGPTLAAHGVIDESASGNSPLYYQLQSIHTYNVFMTATTENPVSHSCVVTNERSKTFIAR